MFALTLMNGDSTINLNNICYCVWCWAI